MMDAWTVTATAIILGALFVDRTRAYRALPLFLNRLRGRSRSSGRRGTLGVDSAESFPVRADASDVPGREKEPRHGPGH